MQDAKPPESVGPLGRAAPLVVALSGLWLYLWLCADTSLLYHSERRAVWFPAPPCLRTFAAESLARPGGPVDYAAAWLSQLYYYPMLGAAVVTAVAGLLALASAGYLTLTLGRRPRVLHVIPALLSGLPFARYGNPLEPALAVLAAAAAAWAYAALPKRWPAARVVAFVVLAAACYRLAAAASLLFALLCALHEAMGRRWVTAAIALVLGGMVPLAGARVMGVPTGYACTRLLFLDPSLDPVARTFAIPLYLALPVLVLAAAAGRRAASRFRWGGAMRGALGAGAGLAVVLGLWAAGLYLLDDPQGRAVMRIDRCLAERDWDGAIAQANLLSWRRFDLPVLWDVNRALAHTGRMGSRMFDYPQSPAGLMPMPVDLHPGLEEERLGGASRVAYLKCMDAMYDLGRLNDTELIAHEAWEMVGQHPRVLRKLAMVNVAKGDPEAAARFLRALSCDPVWRAWCLSLLARLQDDPRLAGDPEVERLRRTRDVRDARTYLREEQTLLDLLAADSGDRLAFRYLMAHYLLTRQLEKFVGQLGRLREMGYAELPRHYAEALQLYRMLTLQAAEVPGYDVPPKTKKDVEDFFAVLKSYGRDREGARLALVGDHRDSYPFYYVFARPEE